jgi:Protein of unknown function (DUF1573)
MKNLFILLLLNLLCFGSFSQNGPKIDFREETINYGTITKGIDNGKRVFVFTNNGDAPLVIKSVNSSCTCAVVSYSKEAIAPGKTSEIEVQYNMNPGPISKTITVETNAINKQDGIVALRIKGTVVVKG